jgi:hypothetical protein
MMNFSAILQKIRLNYVPFWQRTKPILFTGIILFMLGSAGIALYANWTVLVNFDWQINLFALTMTFVFYVINLLLIGWGWSLIAASVSIKGTVFEHFRIFVLSNLGKRLPGTLWYVAGRVAMYQKPETSKSTVALASGIEAVLLLNGAIVCYLAFSAFSLVPHYYIGWLLAIVLLSAITIHPKVVALALRRFRHTDKAVTAFRYRQLLIWLLIYIAGWACGGITVFWWLRALTSISWSTMPAIIAAWALAGSLSSLLIISPSGLGIREVTLVVMLSSIVPQPIAVVAAIMLRVLLTGYQAVIAGLVFVFSR